MKEYLIRVHFDSYVDVKVNAENDDDAKRIAESESRNRELCPRFPSATGFDFIESKDVKLTIKEQIDNLWDEIYGVLGHNFREEDFDFEKEIKCNVIGDDVLNDSGTMYVDYVALHSSYFEVSTSYCDSDFYDKTIEDSDIDDESKLKILKAIVEMLKERYAEDEDDE